MSMSDEGRQDSEPIDFTPHRMAPRARTDSGEDSNAGMAVLTGFVGESAQAGHIRLYLDLSFSSYCEIATKDVVKTKKVDASDDDSPTVLWVTGAAQVGLVRVGQTSGTASFISGAIRDGHAARRATYAERAMALSSEFPCSMDLFDCEVPGGPLPSNGWCYSVQICPPPGSGIFCT
jgi:hypothetical protein